MCASFGAPCEVARWWRNSPPKGGRTQGCVRVERGPGWPAARPRRHLAEFSAMDGRKPPRLGGPFLLVTSLLGKQKRSDSAAEGGRKLLILILILILLPPLTWPWFELASSRPNTRH